MSVRTGRGIRGSPRRGLVVLALLSLVSLTLFAVPAGADSTGTVYATVTVDGPCITTSETFVDFGTVGFSQVAANTIASGGSFNLLNCSGHQQEYYGRASDTLSGATWLIQKWDGSALACSWGTDAFGAGLEENVGGTEFWLEFIFDTFMFQSPSASIPMTPLILMPCAGSSGIGSTVDFEYSITAALP